MSHTPRTVPPAVTEAENPQPADTNGRDARGRFASGNLGGPGNPFARQVAELRSVLMECVTKEDMKFIGEQLVVMARLGDLAAVKLLFQYILGKPAATVDPDTLDYQELEQQRRAPTPEDLQDIQGRLPPAAAAEILRYTQPCKDQQMREALVGGLRRMDEAQAAGDVIDPLEIADDAIDEVLGRTHGGLDDYEASAPSPNGELSDDPCPTMTPLPHGKARSEPHAPGASRNANHSPHDSSSKR